MARTLGGSLWNRRFHDLSTARRILPGSDTERLPFSLAETQLQRRSIRAIDRADALSPACWVNIVFKKIVRARHTLLLLEMGPGHQQCSAVFAHHQGVNL